MTTRRAYHHAMTDDGQMTRQERRQERARKIAEIRRQTAEISARIGRSQIPEAGPELADQIQALAGEVREVRDALAAAYTAAGLGAREDDRPALRVIQGGASLGVTLTEFLTGATAALPSHLHGEGDRPPAQLKWQAGRCLPSRVSRGLVGVVVESRAAVVRVLPG